MKIKSPFLIKSVLSDEETRVSANRIESPLVSSNEQLKDVNFEEEFQDVSFDVSNFETHDHNANYPNQAVLDDMRPPSPIRVSNEVRCMIQDIRNKPYDGYVERENKFPPLETFDPSRTIYDQPALIDLFDHSDMNSQPKAVDNNIASHELLIKTYPHFLMFLSFVLLLHYLHLNKNDIFGLSSHFNDQSLVSSTEPGFDDIMKLDNLFDDNENLNLLLYSLIRSETLDSFSFNRMTLNYSFKATMLDYKDKTVTFKPFNKSSALLVPKRLGSFKFATIADFFTELGFSNIVYEPLIKDILINSYQDSYSVTLDPDKILLSYESDRLKGIGYDGDDLRIKTTVAKSIVENWSQEKVHPYETRINSVYLVKDKKLLIPPSIDSYQGLKIPFSLIRNNLSLIRSLEAVYGLTLNKSFMIASHREFVSHSPSVNSTSNALKEIASKMYYEDFVTKHIANQLRSDKGSIMHTMESILKFVNSFDYVPDPNFEVARHTLDFLISAGGDCDDRALMIHNLAMALDIDCVLVNYRTTFEGDYHAIAACIYDSNTKGFNLSKEGSVTYEQSGKYKPMDYDNPSELSFEFYSDFPDLKLLRREGKEVKIYLDFVNN